MLFVAVAAAVSAGAGVGVGVDVGAGVGVGVFAVRVYVRVLGCVWLSMRVCAYYSVVLFVCSYFRSVVHSFACLVFVVIVAS